MNKYLILKTFSALLLAALLTSSYSIAQTTEVELNGKGNQTHTYRSNTGVTSTDLEYRGKIIFTDDEKDVKYISPGGFLKFSKRSFGNKRTIELEGEANGVINRTYWEGSSKTPFEPEGKNWMASVLPEIIRTTGIGAEERVAKFYKIGGMNAVLEEISKLPSDYVQGKYYSAAFEMNNLSTSEVKMILNHASDELSSSYEQSKLLRGNSQIYAQSEENMEAAIKYVEDINSSYEQSKIYKHFLTEEELSETNKALVIKGVREISSTYEQSQVLQAILKDELTPENIDLVLQEASNISSSYEQSKILQLIIQNQPTEEIDFDMLVKAISSINSSYEQSKALKYLVNNRNLNSKQIQGVADASTYISSDYEKSKLLQSLISNQDLDKEGLDAVLKASDDVNSSYEKTKILQLVISSDNFEKSNYANVIGYATEISSNYDQSKVLTLIANKSDLSDNDQLLLIQAIDDLSSNYEKAKLLIVFAENVSSSTEVREEFMAVAKTLSDTDYGKVMRAMKY